jgi:hypothetical protein
MSPVLPIKVFYSDKSRGKSNIVGAKGDKSYPCRESGKHSLVKEIGLGMGRNFFYTSLGK